MVLFGILLGMAGGALLGSMLACASEEQKCRELSEKLEKEAKELRRETRNRQENTQRRCQNALSKAHLSVIDEKVRMMVAQCKRISTEENELRKYRKKLKAKADKMSSTSAKRELDEVSEVLKRYREQKLSLSEEIRKLKRLSSAADISTALPSNGLMVR